MQPPTGGTILDRVEHRHTINTGGTAAKPTTNIKINNNSYTENLTGSAGRADSSRRSNCTSCSYTTLPDSTQRAEDSAPTGAGTYPSLTTAAVALTAQ